jgi:hypothetical protein
MYNMNKIWTIDGYIFKHPFNCIISGPTSCGKTFLLAEILKFKDSLIDKAPTDVVYCYKSWQPTYDKIKMQNQHIQFHEGIPEVNVMRNIRDAIVIFDDLNTQCINNEEVMDIFTVGSHHRNISAIVLSQNIFSKGKFSREISLNSNYLILFKNPRDQLQFQILSRQMYPGKSKFLQEAFADATKLPHGYLLLDLMQETPTSDRVQSGILPDQTRIIYTPIS